MTQKLPFQDLEKVYDMIATAIDEVGQDREALFLCKLCMTLAHEIGDLSVIENAITIAAADLDV